MLAIFHDWKVKESAMFCFIINVYLSTKIVFIFNEGSLKRKSDGADLSSTIRQSPKTLAFNFASSTPATVTSNKHPNTSSSEY